MNAVQALDKLTAYVERQDFKGYDPYDGLNSPILRLLSLGQKYGRIAFIQGMKRSPINLRPLLFVKKGHNPKGLGLFLWGYAKLFKVDGDERRLATVDRLLQLLTDSRSQGYSGSCWGYNFDWQSRAFFVPKYTPTIVNSSFIGHALLDTYKFTGKLQALDLALSIKDFLCQDLNRTVDNETFCFSYTPIDNTMVHNANLLGASFLIHLNEYARSSEIEDMAIRSLNYTMNLQRSDGSWWYADTDYQKWIDSFHTGFNLQCIRYFLDIGKATHYRPAYEQGVEYYANNFFLADGTAKYFHDRKLPIDIHSYAQAIVFFSAMGEKHRELVDRIVTKMIQTFQHRDGHFYFQKKRQYTVTIPYMRWSQSWAFHALTEHLLHKGIA